MLKNFSVNTEQDKVIKKSKHFPVTHTMIKRFGHFKVFAIHQMMDDVHLKAGLNPNQAVTD